MAFLRILRKLGHVRRGIRTGWIHRPPGVARGAQGGAHQLRRNAPAAEGARDPRMSNCHHAVGKRVIKVRAAAVHQSGELLRNWIMTNAAHAPLCAPRGAAPVLVRVLARPWVRVSVQPWVPASARPWA